MDIGNTKGETTYRRGGGVHNSQGRGGQEVETNSGEISLYIKGGMEVGRLEDSTSEGREIQHKESTEGASRFSARVTGGQTAKVASGGHKHRGVTGSRQVQGGLESPHAVVPPREV